MASKVPMGSRPAGAVASKVPAKVATVVQGQRAQKGPMSLNRMLRAPSSFIVFVFFLVDRELILSSPYQTASDVDAQRQRARDADIPDSSEED
jgi:hypothetical protein